MQSDQSVCSSLKYSLSVELLVEYLLEFLSLKEDCTGSSESTLVKNATSLGITSRGLNDLQDEGQGKKKQYADISDVLTPF